MDMPTKQAEQDRKGGGHCEVPTEPLDKHVEGEKDTSAAGITESAVIHGRSDERKDQFRVTTSNTDKEAGSEVVPMPPTAQEIAGLVQLEAELLRIMPLPTPVHVAEALPGAYALGGPGQLDTSSIDITRVGAHLDTDRIQRSVNTQGAPVHEAGLVEATPLSEDPEGQARETTDATAVDEAGIAQRSRQRKKESRFKMQRDAFAAFVLLCLILLIVFVVIFFRDDGSNSSAELRTAAISPTLSPTSFLSATPSVFEAGFLDQLPDYTMKSLVNASSPQRLAMNWLQDYPNVTDLEDWRRTQLFVLATLFYSFEGPNWRKDIRDNWMDTTKHECFWYSGLLGTYLLDGSYHDVSNASYGFDGTYCNQRGEVMSLYLSDLELWGLHPAIPPEIVLLETLNELSLTFNEITTSLQAMIPTHFYTMKKIRRLNLMVNYLSGTLASEFGLLPEFQALVLRTSGHISGAIPSQLGLLTKMTHISLSGASITGTIPTQVGMLSLLENLDLDRLSMGGTIPSQLGMLTNLESLGLEYNSFIGTVPTELGQLSKLYWGFKMENNLLAGNVPSEFGSFSSLRMMFLEDNFFSSFPSELGLLSNMTVFRACNNSFSGTIHSELGLLSSLANFELADNSLYGPIPSELGNAEQLVRLDLGRNLLTASVPTELAMLGGLERLHLDSNSLEGELPSLLGLLSGLKILDLSKNVLSGSIPSELGTLTALGELYLGSNSLMGSLPTDFGTLTALVALDISGLRHLIGSVPLEIALLASAHNLSSFILNGTINLNGTIPESLCYLEDDACNFTDMNNRWGPPTPCSFEYECTSTFCGCDCNCSE